MPNIQIAAERKYQFLELHRQWARELPRSEGQIGSAMTSLIEGPPVYAPIMPYSDFDPIRYIGVDQSLVAFLQAKGFPFEEN